MDFRHYEGYRVLYSTVQDEGAFLQYCTAHLRDLYKAAGARIAHEWDLRSFQAVRLEEARSHATRVPTVPPAAEDCGDGVREQCLVFGCEYDHLVILHAIGAEVGAHEVAQLVAAVHAPVAVGRAAGAAVTAAVRRTHRA